MKKVIVLFTLLAFVFAGSVMLASAAEKSVCCKDGKAISAKSAADCTKAGGKVVTADKCKAPAKKK